MNQLDFVKRENIIFWCKEIKKIFYHIIRQNNVRLSCDLYQDAESEALLALIEISQKNPSKQKDFKFLRAVIYQACYYWIFGVWLKLNGYLFSHHAVEFPRRCQNAKLNFLEHFNQIENSIKVNSNYCWFALRFIAPETTFENLPKDLSLAQLNYVRLSETKYFDKMLGWIKFVELTAIFNWIRYGF